VHPGRKKPTCSRKKDFSLSNCRKANGDVLELLHQRKEGWTQKESLRGRWKGGKYRGAQLRGESLWKENGRLWGGERKCDLRKVQALGFEVQGKKSKRKPVHVKHVAPRRS